MRINLYSGPGCGKSLLAAWLFQQLRIDGVAVEQVQEAIKPRAYRGAWPSAWENFTTIMAAQVEREREWLESGVPNIVTDSPVFLQCYYMAARNAAPTIGCLHIARAWEEAHPALNVFLTRSKHIAFQQAGRYQDRKESERIDATLAEFLAAEGVECERFDAFDRTDILAHVVDAIRNENPVALPVGGVTRHTGGNEGGGP